MRQISDNAELSEIVAWIIDGTLKGAECWLAVLEQNVGQLPRVAAPSSSAAEADVSGVDLRQRLFKALRDNTNRLVFIVQNKKIYALVVRGAGQDLPQREEIEIPE